MGSKLYFSSFSKPKQCCPFQHSFVPLLDNLKGPVHLDCLVHLYVHPQATGALEHDSGFGVDGGAGQGTEHLAPFQYPVHFYCISSAHI